ncbi:MAG: site-2 protease family protein, partial [Oscillospiraceae bacterium]|nr:site-2 protease family protein [Oscillospiraceae bacterium]
MSIVSILVAVAVFFVIVVLHEFGHFAVAKLCGVKVNEFAVGMGPVLLKHKKGETQYSIRALPIGGFCAMEGEDGTSDNPRAFSRKSVPQRLAVVFAGPIMNLILGFLLIICTTLLYGDIATLKIAEFRTNPDTGEVTAMSAQTGLQVGDEILRIDGMRILTDSDLSYKLTSTEAETMELVVLRDGKKVTLPAVQFYNTYTQGRL